MNHLSSPGTNRRATTLKEVASLTPDLKEGLLLLPSGESLNFPEIRCAEFFLVVFLIIFFLRTVLYTSIYGFSYYNYFQSILKNNYTRKQMLMRLYKNNIPKANLPPPPHALENL